MAITDAMYTDHKDATTDANGQVLYGLDKELYEKAAAKYDREVEAKCIAWLEELTGTELNGPFQEWIKSGVVLCNACNAIKPGICSKPYAGKMAFKQMENISNYTAACISLGVPVFNTFQTVDLYENKDKLAVLNNIQALGSASQKVQGYHGPIMGVKVADTNVRDFTEEQLAAGRCCQTFLGKGSHGTAGSEMGAQIDRSKDINKMACVAGEVGHLGKDGTATALGVGSHGTAGTTMGTAIDRSREVNKLAAVKGADGLGTDGTITALGKGSQGQAAAFQADTSREIDRMTHVR